MSYIKKIQKMTKVKADTDYDSWLDQFESMEEFEDELEDLEQDHDKAKSALRTLEGILDSSAMGPGDDFLLYPESVKALRKEIKEVEEWFKGIKEAANKKFK